MHEVVKDTWVISKFYIVSVTFSSSTPGYFHSSMRDISYILAVLSGMKHPPSSKVIIFFFISTL